MDDPPQSLEKRASQALFSHVDLPPERESDGLSTVNICCAPVSPSFFEQTDLDLLPFFPHQYLSDQEIPVTPAGTMYSSNGEDLLDQWVMDV